jgi:hypothetical protein
MEHCGQFAAPFIPRRGEFYTCVLPKGHKPEGDHRAGGTCPVHGDYVMERFGKPPRCPHWPECAEIFVKQQAVPVTVK